VALIGATGCLAAVAYAASAPKPAGAPRADAPEPPAAAAAASRASGRHPRGSRPPRPRIVRHPAKTTVSTSAHFRISDPRLDVGFECKLDRARWKTCGARVTYRGLAVAGHRFSVRARGPGGAPSRAARFAWAQAEPADFSITPQPADFDGLYPGAPPASFPLLVENPNPAPIFVTSLRVSVSADAASCNSAENLDLIPSNASAATPLTVPAGGSVSLPAQGISPPALALRDLPFDQDACQGAEFRLDFSGEAHG
jgi:hypothetical protein